jgi:hypothetical protein
MRRIATIITILAGLLAGVSAAAAQGFFELLEDVPVMPALTPVNDAGIEFDAPSGRIVEAYAIGATNREAVTEFYRTTLPQLGWQPGAGNAFRRESESLKIDFFGPDGEITVRFTVAPASSGG